VWVEETILNTLHYIMCGKHHTEETRLKQRRARLKEVAWLKEYCAGKDYLNWEKEYDARHQ
jgi:hypothetical protein